jgi:hypothetical protein
LKSDPLNLRNIQIARQNYQTAFAATVFYLNVLRTPQVFNLYAYVSNNPIILYDPKGLIIWRAVVKGGLAVIGGAISAAVGSAASTTGVGAIVGVPMVIGGSVSIGWGVSELITGFLDVDLILPKPSAASLTTLLVTGDVDQACKADLAEDIILLGTNVGKMAGTMPSNLDILGNSLDFVDLSIQAKSIEDQFKK